jgi:hypothetical protein
MKQNVEPLTRFAIFPNPSVGDVNVLISGVMDRTINVTILDILGKEVKDVFSGQVMQDNLQLETNLSSLDKGIYFISVSEGNTVINTDKIVLNK